MKREFTKIHKENLSKSHIGKVGFWTGRKRSPEDIEKFRRSHLGKKLSDITKEKLRLVHLGKPKSSEHKANISKGRLGIKFSSEHCENISKGKMGGVPWNKGRKCPQLAGNNNYGYGKSKPEEIRRKISDSLRGRIGAHKGKKFSPEWRENMARVRRGKKLTEEHKKKIGIAHTGMKNGFYRI